MTGELRVRRRSAHVCLRCGHDGAEVVRYSDTLEHKGLLLDIEGLVETRCSSCGHTWCTDGQQVDNVALVKAAYATRRDEVRADEGLLTSAQIADILDQLKLKTREAAELFGGGPHAFSKYLSGDVLQSTAMDKLLRVVFAFGEPALAYLRKGKEAPLQLGAAMPAAEAMPSTTLVYVVDSGPRRAGTSASHAQNLNVALGAPPAHRTQWGRVEMRSA